MSVEVPEEFRRLGYSGLFHTESKFGGTAEQLDEWKAKVPFLLPTPGWMALSVDADRGTVTVVRTDMGAVVDVGVRRPA